MSPSDYPVDPDILARIRPMEMRDVPVVSKMHAAMMGHTLWGKLGTDFLETIYSLLLKQPAFLAFVYEQGGRVRGFIAGTEDGPDMMRAVAKANFFTLTRATLCGVLRSPAAISPLLSTFLYFKKSNPPVLADVTAESMFCAFEPDFRGKRISGLINKILFDELAHRGHKALKITSESTNPGALRQLTNWGFEQVGRFHFYGKEMIAWKLDLEKSSRVEAVARWDFYN